MEPVLIAGAGPTGLAAALFLSDLGVACRIVDPAPEPSKTSKALAVNPRTQALLEPTGVAARMAAEGRPIRSLQLRSNGRLAALLDVEGVDPRFPMLALPQATTERLLTEALAGRGVRVEREVAVEGVRNLPDAVAADLRRTGGGVETVRAPALLGADGAHSPVRHALGLSFDGDAEPRQLLLADVVFDRPVADSEGFVEFLPRGGFIFCLAFDALHWRVIGTGEEMFDHLPDGVVVAETSWRSAFKISHRIAGALNVGRVCLAGDAAHIHSPIGARGMNLGIEDAYVFAHCCKEALDGAPGRLADYGRLRRAVDGALVDRIRLLTRVALGEGAPGRLRALVPTLLHLPAVRRLMRRTVAGLDHPVRLS